MGQGVVVKENRDLDVTDHMIKVSNELLYDWLQKLDMLEPINISWSLTLAPTPIAYKGQAFLGSVV